MLLIHCLNLPVMPDVANSYLSHVSRFLLDNEYILFPHELHSSRATQILRGAKKESDSHIPARLRVKIPLTYPFACAACDIATTLLCVQCGIMLGFGLSTRPQELLHVQADAPLSHHANSSLSFFWFSNIPYNVCYPSLYPPGHLPDGFSLLLDFHKNHQQGAGGPRAVWRSTHPQGRCCVLTAFAFLSAHPPAPDTPLLSALGTQLSAATINVVFKATAKRQGLDPKRLLPHSMRFGVIYQLDSAGFDDATKRATGQRLKVCSYIAMLQSTMQSVLHILCTMLPFYRYSTLSTRIAHPYLVHLHHVMSLPPPLHPLRLGPSDLARGDYNAVFAIPLLLPQIGFSILLLLVLLDTLWEGRPPVEE
jgi:hypothetical protein